MWAYIVRRLLLIVPTLFGIMLINFAIVQFAPGGPVEFQVQYACPALVTGAQGRTFPAGDKSQQGVE